MKIRLLTLIQAGRVRFPAGSTLDPSDDATAESLDNAGFDRDEVARLIKAGVLVIVDESATPAAVVAGPSDSDEFYRHLNATEAISYVGMVRSTTLLESIAGVENARPKGPRKTVADAIEARRGELHVEQTGGVDPNAGDPES